MVRCTRLRSQNFEMKGVVENDVTFYQTLYTGADPESFGGGNVILNWVNVN